MNFGLRLGLVLGLIAGSLLGCGDDDSDAHGHDGGEAGSGSNAGSPAPTVDPGEEASAEITADEGGELALGAVTLDVPAGALAEDITLTVEALDPADQPDAANIVADVFDFGPDGTEFLMPVTLEFEIGDLDVSSNRRAVIAYLDGDSWVPLEDSALGDGTITATTTHFTPFTVVLVVREDGTVDQTGGACDTEGFDACGGDIEGTWEYGAACVTIPPGGIGTGSGDNPFAMCTDAPEFAITVDLTGTATFNADGTYEIDQVLTTTSDLTIPASCIEELVSAQPGTDPATACEQVIMGMTDADGNCLSPGEPEANPTMESGTYTTDNGMLVGMGDAANPDAGTANEEVHYCVEGDTLTVVVNDLEQGFTVKYSATRQ